MRASFAVVICAVTLFVVGVSVLPGSGNDPPLDPVAQGGGGEDFLSQAIEPADPRDVEQVSGADIQPAGLLCCPPDDRIQITDTSPWSYIVYLEIYDSIGTFLGHCTGTFIGPDALLTAGHCLYDSITGWTGFIRVVPAKNGFIEPLGSQFAVNWWVPDEWILFDNTLWDWGVIKMPDSTLGNTAGWLAVAVATNDTLSRSDFEPAIVGYPRDKPIGTMWFGYKDSFLLVGVNNLYYEIDTSSGQSGSAIFSSHIGEPFFGWVVGVHTTGGSFWNSGTRINFVQLLDILEGCVQMGCTIEWLIESAATPTPTPTLAPCPLVPWLVPVGDTDCDGYVTGDADSGEVFFGTDPADPCSDTTTPNDERGSAFGEPEPAWPPDINDDQQVDFGDILRFSLHFGKTFPDADYSERFDLKIDGTVDFGDILFAYTLVSFNQKCTDYFTP